MSRNPRRLIALSVAVVMLLTLAAMPASALTLQRKWSTKINASSGSVTLRAYTDGSGTISYKLKNLRKSRTYKVQIRKGTCGNPGKLVTQIGYVKTTSSGTLASLDSIPVWQMNKIWPVSRNKGMIIRITRGSQVRCGKFSFATATRIKISQYGINLPVIKSPNKYPPCGTAMYLKELYQPTEPGVTFLFGHARTGMFLPLLTASKTNDGAAMLGMVVKVWTSNNRVHYYKIDTVRRHVKTLDGIFGVTAERLWIQTSEGPNFTYPKLIIEGYRYYTKKATYSASHPRSRAYSC